MLRQKHTAVAALQVMLRICGRIQNLVCTQLESTSNIIKVKSRILHLNVIFSFEIWMSESSGNATGGRSDLQIMSPGGECSAQHNFDLSLLSFSLVALLLFELSLC